MGGDSSLASALGAAADVATKLTSAMVGFAKSWWGSTATVNNFWFCFFFIYQN